MVDVVPLRHEFSDGIQNVFTEKGELELGQVIEGNLIAEHSHIEGNLRGVCLQVELCKSARRRKLSEETLRTPKQ